MRRIREQFPNELVVIGVHSAKFPTEQLTANIRQAVLRHGIQHPVVNDAGFAIWNSYTVHAWPTLVLVDPRGKIAYEHSGEIEADELIPMIEEWLAEYDAQGLIDRSPIILNPEVEREPLRPLNYPSRLALAPGGRLYVADTGHHRIVELQLDESALKAEIQRVFGSGKSGLQDGAAQQARFDSPHGLALSGSSLYVADTENHAVRCIDLKNNLVTTIAGTGHKGNYGDEIKLPIMTGLRSPWALLAVEAESDGSNPVLFIAMAGSHQVWVQVGGTPMDENFGIFAGNGLEALVDGSPGEASFNQPSDLALGLNHLFVADPEASAVRAISLSQEPKVLTLVGQGLFEFGDVDGLGANVRLQHPTGLAYANEKVYIADSYNHKIKSLNPLTGILTTLIGDGKAGHNDGPFEQARLYEPLGLAVAGQHLFIADTNNHLIRVADLTNQTLHTLTITGLERLAPIHNAVASPTPQRLETLEVGPGKVEITWNWQLPAGYKLNPDAPVMLEWTDGKGTHHSQTYQNGEAVKIALVSDHPQQVEFDLTLYFCQETAAQLCLIHQARLILPLSVVPGGKMAVNLGYKIPT